MSNLSLGQKIKLYRQRAKLSQFELEIEIGASAGSISRLENNLVNPTKETLLHLSQVLDLSFDEKVDFFGLNYAEVEKYIPEKFLKQKLTNNISLNNILSMKFLDYAFVKGKDYFIKECDSSLEIPSNEVLYIQNIHSWRKGYSEEEANARHVPKRIKLNKFAKFLINDCQDAGLFQKRDQELYRETRLIKEKSNFDYTLMIEQSSITVFITEPNLTAFTVKNDEIVQNARKVFQAMWHDNK